METPEKIDWSKANKDNIPVDEEPELDKNEEKPLHPIWDKCGVVIEDNSVYFNEVNNKNLAQKEPEFKEGDEVEGKVTEEANFIGVKCFYTGGKTKRGQFICEYEDGSICLFVEIRKHDPDKHLKEIAKEILIKWDFIREDGKCDPDILSMLIEALKKGGSLAR